MIHQYPISLLIRYIYHILTFMLVVNLPKKANQVEDFTNKLASKNGDI